MYDPWVMNLKVLSKTFLRQRGRGDGWEWGWGWGMGMVEWQFYVMNAFSSLSPLIFFFFFCGGLPLLCLPLDMTPVVGP